MCKKLNNNVYIFNFREYLATFKKTVAMHETFLVRLATHPIFRNDHNFRVFLSYDGEVMKSLNKYMKYTFVINFY